MRVSSRKESTVIPKITKGNECGIKTKQKNGSLGGHKFMLSPGLQQNKTNEIPAKINYFLIRQMATISCTDFLKIT